MLLSPLTFPGRRRLPFLLLALLAALSTRSTDAASPEPAGEIVKLKAAHVADENFAWHKAFERFRDTLRVKSSNTVEVQIFANGVLGTEKDYVQYLVQGLLDMAAVAPSSASGLVREAAFLDLLYLWKDRDHWQRTLDADLGRQMAEILEKGTAKGGNPGFRVLGYWGGSELYVASRARGYELVKDLAGRKLRTQESPIQHEAWRVLGASPVVLPFQATLNGLQSGSIDGVEGSAATVLNSKLFESAPHLTQTGHALTVRPLFMSGHAWRKLNPQQQKAVLEAAKEATAAARAVEWQQAQDAEAQLRTRAEVQFHPFKEKQQMREQTQAVRQRVAAELGLQALLAATDEGWTENGARAPKKK